MINTVIFDFDGVLSDSEKYYYEFNKMIADKYQVTYDFKTYQALHQGKRSKYFIKYINDKANNNHEEEILQLQITFNENKINNYTLKDVYPSSEELLVQLKLLGVRLIVCSSNRRVKEYLVKAELINYFDYIADERDLINKADPNFFNDFYIKHNISKSDSLFIDDTNSIIDLLKSININCLFFNDCYIGPNNALDILSTYHFINYNSKREK